MSVYTLQKQLHKFSPVFQIVQVLEVFFYDHTFFPAPAYGVLFILDSVQHNCKYNWFWKIFRHTICNIDIAYKMFIVQCIDKAMIEQADKIMVRIFRFLPAHLKLQSAVITQQNCLNYLENDTPYKLVLPDVPYIGSEHTCSVQIINISPFIGKYLTYYEKRHSHFCTTAEVHHQNQIAFSIGQMQNISWRWNWENIS